MMFFAITLVLVFSVMVVVASDAVSKLDYVVEGEYAVAEVDEFSDFVFVKVVDAQTPTPILMFAIIAIAVLLLVGIVFIARR